MKGKRFKYGENGKFELKKYLIFINVHEYMVVLKDFITQENFDIINVKIKKSRCTSICITKNCTWRIHASPMPNSICYMKKINNETQSCIKKKKI